MLFTSIYFFTFFPLVFLLYYLLPHAFRWMLLLISSLLFYMVFSWQYTIFFSGLILVNYWLGRNIFSSSGRLRKGLYRSGIFFNMLVLCFFKYSGFLNIDFIRIADLLHLHYPLPMIRWILPLGLSYLIFTILAYLIDIKRKKIIPEKHAGILALYFLFFPKIAQGPIERPGSLLPQFHSRHTFNYENITYGLKRMAWGFFKKLVISDTIALFVNTVYADSAHTSGPFLILGTILFSFQIYADFSGYTDIALGLAALFGFRLTENFRRPYLSASVQEFWNRWHISFSTWLRDYIFLPLAYWFSGKLKKARYLYIATEKWIYFFSIMITFYICGLWHGEGLHYQVWGLLFGFLLTVSNWTQKPARNIRKKFHIIKTSGGYRITQILLTFLLLNFTWIFFRSEGLPEAKTILVNIFHGWSWNAMELSWTSLLQHGINERVMGIILVSTGILIMTDLLSEKKDVFLRLAASPVYVRWAVYYLVILLMIVYSTTGNRQFIYLQF